MVLIHKKREKQLQFNVRVSPVSQFVIKLKKRIAFLKFLWIALFARNIVFWLNFWIVVLGLIKFRALFFEGSDTLTFFSPGLYRIGLYRLAIIPCSYVKFLLGGWVVFNLAYMYLAFIFGKNTATYLFTLWLAILLILNIFWFKLFLLVRC